MRCPMGHPVNPIAGTSFNKQVVKFAVLAAGIPVAGAILFSRIVVVSAWFGWSRIVVASPWFIWSIIAVLTVLMPLIFVVWGVISLARWSKRRQAIGTPSAEYAKEQLAQGIGLLAGTALIVLIVSIPVLLNPVLLKSK